jgi:lysophospholipase L1-like esterase
VVGAASALALLEAGLHLFPGLLPPAVRQALAIYADAGQTADINRPFVPNDQLQYAPRPNVDVVIHDGLSLSYTVQTQSLGGSDIGFRDVDPGAKPYAVATGDSQTWGTYVAGDQTWPNQLEAALGQPVLNMAVLGYAPPQYQIITERYALPLHPRVMLWGFFSANDGSDSADFEAWVEAGKPPVRLTQPESGLRDFLSRHVRMYELLKFLLHAGIYYQRGAVQQAVVVPAPGGPAWTFYPDTLEALADGRRPHVARGWELAEAAILETRSAVEAAGAELVLVVLPPKEVIYADLWRARVADPAAYDLAEPERTIMAFCQAQSLKCLDVAPAFATHAAAGEELYLRQDAHLTPAGHHVVAEMVKEYLAEKGLGP